MSTAFGNIEVVHTLYIELMYRCNYNCLHCFHGERLQDASSLASGQVNQVVDHFRETYSTSRVVFLGGEPLLYPDIVGVCKHAAESGLAVEICTNGHEGFRARVVAIAPFLDHLRVSIDGLEEANDAIRRPGSFRGAIQTIRLARALGIRVGVTLTVTSLNAVDVVPLAFRLEDLGVEELKLHALRLVGNAARNPDLGEIDAASLQKLQVEISSYAGDLKILFDDDLLPGSRGRASATSMRPAREAERVELDPCGGITFSCKAVGLDLNAYRWDARAGCVVKANRPTNELSLAVPAVRYLPAFEQPPLEHVTH